MYAFPSKYDNFDGQEMWKEYTRTRFQERCAQGTPPVSMERLRLRWADVVADDALSILRVQKLESRSVIVEGDPVPSWIAPPTKKHRYPEPG